MTDCSERVDRNREWFSKNLSQLLVASLAAVPKYSIQHIDALIQLFLYRYPLHFIYFLKLFIAKT